MGEATERSQSKGDYGAREALRKTADQKSVKTAYDKTPYKHR